MAITKVNNMIKFGAAGDAYYASTHIKVMSITLEHSGAANATLTDTAGGPVAMIRVGTSDLHQQYDFPCGIIVKGLIASVLSAGNLYVEIV